jgi:NADPH:quinone reductase-like Zn-dependent oxidoreductase
MNFEQAAAFPVVFMTAWHGLVYLGKVQPNETVLVQAGSSGVGMAAIQIAKARGAKVMATVGSDEKAAKAKALGADVVVNYKQKDFVEEAKSWTGGRGVDVVLDSVGKETFTKGLDALAKGGRLLAMGSTSGRDVSFDLRVLFGKNITVHGFRTGRRDGLVSALENFSAGHLQVIIDRTFPLAQAAEAQAYMESGRHFGKIVLTV